jgi:CDP-diacylglycerol---glycerol-3-phosphate 3-phosphatidyltransferase
MDRGSTPRLRHAPPARALAHRTLSPIARKLVAAGVSANAVTAVSLLLGLLGAVMLATGRFGIAAPFIVLASLGDALDGVTARVGATASPQGALFDASADRYQEAAILCGLAVHLHADVAALALVLGALVASFMVSYGSAKAEALRVPVPGGSMRRFERSVCICLGVAAVPLAGALVSAGVAPAWLAEAPILLALAVVAIVGNASAVARLRLIAASAAPNARPVSTSAPDGSGTVRAP